MALEVKSIDEETRAMVDVYDTFIAPKKVWRNNNNKLYLVLRAMAAGFSRIRDVALASKYRFDPRYCDDDDLESTAYIVGERRRPGKSSLLRVMVTNTSESTVTLSAGTYQYRSVDGELFTSVLETGAAINGLEYTVMLFASEHLGAYPVEASTGILVSMAGGSAVNAALTFDSLDNSGSLGRTDETAWAFRQRLLTDTTRQDALREIENQIKELPTIFDASLIFNSEISNETYDGVVVGPQELLITISGVPTPEIASIVCGKTIYKTHKVTDDMVVYYEHAMYLNGRYPVYYRFYGKSQFYLHVWYKYDVSKTTKQEVDLAITKLYSKYKVAVEHIDRVTSKTLYDDLSGLALSGVEIVHVYLQASENGQMVSVEQVEIPKTRIPELVDLTFTAEAVNNGG